MTYDGPLKGPAIGRPHPKADLYEEDLTLWADDQQKALLELRVDDVDFENVAEEIRCFGLDQRKKLEDHIHSMIKNCLKWKYNRKLREEHEHVTSTWYLQMYTDRTGIEVPLECSPSLESKVPEILAEEYPHARERASWETGLDESCFPETLEWTLEEMMGFPLDPLVMDDAVSGMRSSYPENLIPGKHIPLTSLPSHSGKHRKNARQTTPRSSTWKSKDCAQKESLFPNQAMRSKPRR